jgi:hypothetical protein
MSGCTDGRARPDRDHLVGIVSPTDVARTVQLGTRGGRRVGVDALFNGAERKICRDVG